MAVDKLVDSAALDASLTDIADSIRETYGGLNKMSMAQMASRIRASKTERWQRPSDWPNLDSIDYTGFDGYYLTYKLDIVDPLFRVISLCATTSDGGAWVLERGHLENGVFVSEYSAEYNHRQHHDEPLDAANGNIQLWRVTAKTGKLTCCGVLNAIEKNYPFAAMCAGGQPCVEQYSAGTLLNSANSNPADVYIAGYARLSHSGLWMEHDCIIGETEMTNFQSFWRAALHLRLVDFKSASFPLISVMNQPFGYGTSAVIDFSGASFPNITNAQYLLLGSVSTEVDFSTISAIGDGTRFGENAYNLENLTLPQAITDNLSLAFAPLVSHESLNRIMSALQTVSETKTLSLHRNVKYFLTDEQIAEATGKGWTIS